MVIKIKNEKMKKVVNIIFKSHEIKKRFLEKVKSKIKMIQNNKDKNKNNNNTEDELDDHNDSSNWSYT